MAHRALAATTRVASSRVVARRAASASPLLRAASRRRLARDDDAFRDAFASGCVVARRSRCRSRLVVLAGSPKAKNKDSGRSIHFRKGAERFNTGGVGEGATRGGKGKGKTTRSQRTNKSYKRYVSGRASIDDVERASRGDKTKSMGVVEREAPYRLTRDEREAWERAKRRGPGVGGFAKGVGGGGFVELATKQRDDLAPRRHALVNTHRLYCDAINSVFVCVEQEPTKGEDEIVIDVSTLRVERDGAIRARIESVARAAAAAETTTSGDGSGDGIVSVIDECGDEEPLDAMMRAVEASRVTELAVGPPEMSEMSDADVEVSDGLSEKKKKSAAPPTAADVAAADAAAAAAADAVRELKSLPGKTNADADVAELVRELLAKRATAEATRAAMEANAPEAIATAREAKARETRAIEEEARRMLGELPVHGLPERRVRVTCADRPTAKRVSKALAGANVLEALADAAAAAEEEEVVSSEEVATA